VRARQAERAQLNSILTHSPLVILHDRRLHRPPRRIERGIIPKPLLDQPARQRIQLPAPARPGHPAPRHPSIGLDQIPHRNPTPDTRLRRLARIVGVLQPPLTPPRRHLLAPATVTIAISAAAGAITNPPTSRPRPAHIRRSGGRPRTHSSLLRDYDRRRHHNRHCRRRRHHFGSLRFQIRRRRCSLGLPARRRPRPHLLLGRRWRRRRRIEHLQRIAHRRRHRHHQPIEQRITQHPWQQHSAHRRPDPVSRSRLIACHHADLVSLSPKQSPASDEPALAERRGTLSRTHPHSAVTAGEARDQIKTPPRRRPGPSWEGQGNNERHRPNPCFPAKAGTQSGLPPSRENKEVGTTFDVTQPSQSQSRRTSANNTCPTPQTHAKHGTYPTPRASPYNTPKAPTAKTLPASTLPILHFPKPPKNRALA